MLNRPVGVPTSRGADFWIKLAITEHQYFVSRIVVVLLETNPPQHPHGCKLQDRFDASEPVDLAPLPTCHPQLGLAIRFR